MEYYTVVFNMGRASAVGLAISVDRVREWEGLFKWGEPLMCGGSKVDPHTVRRVQVYKGVEDSQTIVDEVYLAAREDGLLPTLRLGRRGIALAKQAIVMRPEALFELRMFDSDVTDEFFQVPPPRSGGPGSKPTPVPPGAVTNNFYGHVGQAAGVVHGGQHQGASEERWQADAETLLAELSAHRDAAAADILKMKRALAALMARALQGTPSQVAHQLDTEASVEDRKAYAQLVEFAKNVEANLAANLIVQALMSIPGL